MARHKHKVRTHTWVQGLLQTLDYHFDTIEEALAYSSSMKAHSVKIFDDNGELIHSRSLDVVPDQLNIREVADLSYSGFDQGYNYPDIYA